MGGTQGALRVRAHSQRHRLPRRLGLGVLLVVAVLLAAATATGAQGSLDEVAYDGDGAAQLAAAALEDPATLHGARFAQAPPTGGAHAVGTAPLGPMPTDGGQFGLLTTGSAQTAAGDGTGSVNLGGGNVRGNSDYDVSVLEIDVDAAADDSCLRLDFAFLSNEYPAFVGSAYNDAFVAEVGSSTWTASSSTVDAPDNFAFGPDGQAVSVNSTGAAALAGEHAEGTGYSGASTLLSAATPITPGQVNTLYLSVFDQGDGGGDSGVMVDNVRLTADPAEHCVAGAHRADVNPILFVPGITGSSLHDADDFDEIWPRPWKLIGFPLDDSHLLPLELAQNPALHPPLGQEIVPGDIIYEIEKSSVYQDLIDQLEGAGYLRGHNLETVPLDWRRSADLNAEPLLEAVDEVRARTGAERVNVLAHSQGGQVATAALSNPDLDNQGKIDRVVTLGTPFLGSAKSLSILHYGEPCFADFIGICLINREMVNHLAQGWPGFHELLPSAAYDQAVGSALDTVDGGPLTHDEVMTFLIDNGRNPWQLADAAAFHDKYDLWDPADPDVELLRIVGDGLATIVGVEEVLTEECDWWFFNCRYVIDFEFVYGSGDATVAAPSASLVNADTGFDYRGDGLSSFVGPINHGDLAGDSGVLAEVLAFFEGDGAAGSAAVDGMWASDPDAVSATPEAVAGLELIARGPVATVTEDGEGGELSRDTEAASVEHGQAAIAEASLSRAVVSETLFVGAEGSYTTTWTAESEGEVWVRLREYRDSAVAGAVAYPAVALEEGGTITLAHGESIGDDPGPLRVDADGDGTVDAEIGAASRADGEAAADRVAPRSSATVDPVDGRGNRPADEVEVTLEAHDDGSAGVDRIEYVLTATGEIGVYMGEPLVLPAEGELLVRAVDRAGNVEAPHLVVELDEHPGRQGRGRGPDGAQRPESWAPPGH